LTAQAANFAGVSVIWRLKKRVRRHLMFLSCSEKSFDADDSRSTICIFISAGAADRLYLLDGDP